MRQNVKLRCDLAIDMAEYGGTGEKIDDIEDFDAKDYIDNLF